MSENLTNAQNIANIVAQEVELMSALVKLLKKEEEVLVDNTPDKLETIVTEKNTLLTQIIALEKNRNSSLIQNGLSPDAEGMTTLFSQSIRHQKFRTVGNNYLISLQPPKKIIAPMAS